MSKVEVTLPDGNVVTVNEEHLDALHQELMKNFGGGKEQASLADVGKSAGIGLAKGAIGVPGLPGDLASMVPGAADYLRGKAVQYGIMTPESAEADKARETAKGMRTNPFPTSADIQHKVEQTTGPFYEPKSTAGKYAQTVGQFLPMAMTGPGGVARKVASGVGGGIASEAAGQATKGTSFEPWARFGAGIAGGSFPQMAAHAITPFPSTPARQGAVDTLRQAGVTDLTAGQITGNPSLRSLETASGEIPFGGAGAHHMDEAAKGQLVNASLNMMGAAGERATPQVMASAHQRLGQAFDDLAARNQLMYDMPLVRELQQVEQEYGRVLPSQQRDAIHAYFTDIKNQGTSMPGTMYQDTRSRLSRQANSTRQSDPSFSGALRGVRDALDNAMERSISPQDKEAWQTARRQWGNMRRIENAVASSGELITPQSLAAAAKTGRRGQYVRGEGDLDELAQAAKKVMTPLPNSGTPRGLASMTALGTLGGAAFGGAEGAGIGGMTGLAAGHVGAPIAARLLMAPGTQRYLANQKLPHNFEPESRQRLLARALMQSQLPSRLSEQTSEKQ